MLREASLQQKGQSLVEVIVAIGLLGIVFVGSWRVLHSSYMGINKQLVELKAHHLVIEGIEGIRSMRDEDWNALDNEINDTWHFEYIELEPDVWGLSLEEGEETVLDKYRRRIVISDVRRDPDTFKISENPIHEVDANTKLVQVIVEWDYGGVIQNDEQSIYFTNWKNF